MNKDKQDKQVAVRLTTQEVERLDMLCKKYSMNRSEIIRWALQRAK